MNTRFWIPATLVGLLAVGGALLWLNNDRPAATSDIASRHQAAQLPPSFGQEKLTAENRRLIKNESAGAQIFEELISQAKSDPRAAFAAITHISPVSRQRPLRIALAEHLLSSNFAMASEIMVLLESPLESSDVLATVVPIAYKKDAQKTLKVIREQLKGEALNEGLRFVVSEQVRTGDIERAIETQVAMPFSPARANAMVNLANVLADKYSSQAVNWLKRLDDAEQREATPILQSIFVERNNHVELEKLLSATSDPNLRMSLVKSLAVLTSNTGPEALEKFMSALPEKERIAAGSAVLVSNSSLPFDQRIGAAFQIQDSDQSNQAIYSIVAHEVSADPERAAAKALDLRPEDRQRVIRPLVSRWAALDSEGASVWVQKLPAGKDKDAGIAALVTALRATDAKSAEEVAGWTNDPKLYEKLMRQLKR
jgi:hypothetical protein